MVVNGSKIGGRPAEEENTRLINFKEFLDGYSDCYTHLHSDQGSMNRKLCVSL